MQSSKDITSLDAVLRSWRSGAIDPVHRIFWSLSRDRILKYTLEHSSKGERILDLGCEAGEYLIELVKEERIGHGVDPLWETSLLKAPDAVESEGVRVPLFRAAGENLPFKDGGFDLVLCSSTLQHVKNQRATLKEIRRVLGKNGRLVVTVPQTVRRSTFKKRGVYTMHFNLRILTDMLKECGFSVKKIEICGFFPPFSKKVLNCCYPLLGDRGTRKIILILDFFAKKIPRVASSIIVIAEVNQ